MGVSFFCVDSQVEINTCKVEKIKIMGGENTKKEGTKQHMIHYNKMEECEDQGGREFGM